MSTAYTEHDVDRVRQRDARPTTAGEVQRQRRSCCRAIGGQLELSRRGDRHRLQPRPRRGTLAAPVDAGDGHITATAKLISMRRVTRVRRRDAAIIQTWQITSAGIVPVPGAMPATVEVTAMLERDVVERNTYAIFATGAGCGAIDLQRQRRTTDSYDSSGLRGTGRPRRTHGGNVGTNGNMTIGRNVDVQRQPGHRRAPASATCIDGRTDRADRWRRRNRRRHQSVQLPQAKIYPTPTRAQPAAADRPSIRAQAIRRSARVLHRQRQSARPVLQRQRRAPLRLAARRRCVFATMSLGSQVNLGAISAAASSRARDGEL